MHGVVDENTLVWGQGLADWLPIRNVRTLVPQIRTVEGKRWSGGGYRGSRSGCGLIIWHGNG